MNHDPHPMQAMFQPIQEEIDRLTESVRQHERFLPAVSWLINPLWQEARWSGTSYQFHRHGDSPPVMGLVFENPEKGRELFKSWTEKNGNQDELEEIRITVVEGEIPGEKLGYFVHICPDPENSLVRATAEGIVVPELPLSLLGQIRRMNPVPGTPAMLPRFKERFERHGEFLFAPVSPRDDGNHWVDLPLGIVKHAIHFKRIEDVDQALLRAANELLKDMGAGDEPA